VRVVAILSTFLAGLGGSAALAASTTPEPAIDVEDLALVVKNRPREVAGLRLVAWSPNERLANIVDTESHDPYSQAVAPKRATRLRSLGVRRVALAIFEHPGREYSVLVEGLLCPDTIRAARAVAVLRQVHLDTFELNRPTSPRGLGPNAWGYASSVDVDDATAFGFHVANLALEIRVASIGRDFRKIAQAIALDVAEPARVRAQG
jgi:hypothetical protein